MLPHLNPYYLAILVFTNNAPKPPGRNTVSTNTFSSLQHTAVVQHISKKLRLSYSGFFFGKIMSYSCIKVKSNRDPK